MKKRQADATDKPVVPDILEFIKDLWLISKIERHKMTSLIEEDWAKPRRSPE
jgi:hypothetical protein